MAKKLSKKQLRVIEELFAGELGEQAVLDKYKISRKTFNRWLADECFVERFNECVEKSFRQSRLIIARYAPLAAAKLVELTTSDKEETARKACLDIISMRTIPHTNDKQQVISDELSPETAGRILAALAEDEG